MSYCEKGVNEPTVVWSRYSMVLFTEWSLIWKSWDETLGKSSLPAGHTKTSKKKTKMNVNP